MEVRFLHHTFGLRDGTERSSLAATRVRFPSRRIGQVDGVEIRKLVALVLRDFVIDQKASHNFQPAHLISGGRMTTKEKKLFIMEKLGNLLSIAQDKRLKTMCDLSGSEQAARVWKEQQRFEDGVGGRSSCPYNPDLARTKYNEACLQLKSIQETYDYALEQLLED